MRSNNLINFLVLFSVFICPTANAQTILDAKPIYPVQIIIPALGINTKVHDLGVTRTGLMDAPKNLTDVGWYKYGTMPGSFGNAVIDGHLNNGGNIAGIFSNLWKLGVGDSIYLVGMDGRKLEFVMTGSTIYNRNANTAEVFGSTGRPELRIITCEGKWLTSLRTHQSRMVVAAVFKGEVYS